ELQLHKVDLPVISLKQCQKWMRQATYQSICTYTEGKDACIGDSGGPLICSGYQAGITSYGIGCAVKERPGIFQRADIHHDWLRYEPEDNEPGGTAKPSAGVLLLLPLLLAFHAVASRTSTTTLSLQYYLH
ncbi:Trypsin alpha-4, partial [Gryllus bimaculatus]